MKLKVAVLTCAIALIAGGAHAAAQGTTWLGVGVHGSLPMGDFGDQAGFGYGGNLFGTYMVSENVGLGADVGFHWWGGSDDANSAVQATDEGIGALLGDTFTSDAKFNFSAMQFTPHVVYVFPSADGKMMPFLKGGVGIYNAGGKVTDAKYIPDDSSTESNFGFNIGGGVNFMASENYTWGANAAYHTISSDGESVNFISFGLGVMFGVGGK